MPLVDKQRQELRLVEMAWDQLTLLSSMSLLSTKASSGEDLSRARHDFAALADELIQGLVRESLRHSVDDMSSLAQITIDVLVRNLFERTADIGFLAMDESIAEYLHNPTDTGAAHIEQRLREYVQKYSVYSNVFLFDGQGTLLTALQALDADTPVSATQHKKDAAFLQQVLTSADAFVEDFSVHGFANSAEPSLVYAHPVAYQGRVCGALCLQFRLVDEMQALFATLLTQSNSATKGVLLGLVDANGCVLIGSNTQLLQRGYVLDTTEPTSVVTHWGRRYLQVVRETHGFQGYAGPGWRGVALIPMDLAFEDFAEESTAGDVLSASTQLLLPDLQTIPLRSAAIQSALERSVWNGLLELYAVGDKEGVAPRDRLFAQTLLSEVGVTARKTAQAFASALNNLYRGVVAALQRDAQTRADLAMQIVDRNLYERANDCRWWALTPSLGEVLHQGHDEQGSAAKVLEHINNLYTVYSCLVLFDATGKVVAVSQPRMRDRVGSQVHAAWVNKTLQLSGSQAYWVSQWEPSEFYDGLDTFVYSAAVREPQSGRVIGGIAIVWDAQEQLNSVVGACAEGLRADEVLLFSDKNGHVIASSNADLANAYAAVCSPASTCQLNGLTYGVGQSRGWGYREFRAQDGYEHGLTCTVLRMVRDKQAETVTPPALLQQPNLNREKGIHIATCMVGKHWLGLDASCIQLAASDTQILHAGGMRAPFLGMAKVGDRVFHVLDMRDVLDSTTASKPDARLADPNRQLLVLNIPGEGGQRYEFALRVDQLGPMLHVESQRVQPVAMTGDGVAANTMVDAVISLPASDGRQLLLCRVGLRWLRQCAQGNNLAWQEGMNVDAFSP
ncbi:cache domain-containing protein [Curvibacter sp. CHRR-16]|uniref:cache domain-containing protein n=1 Tax=Curvibacter sp. CHRR-16 TaxID=2835872 RepID=UPI002023B0BE|nr:cache domain-containing protein [Curvibacter sp. CHRR-16]